MVCILNGDVVCYSDACETLGCRSVFTSMWYELLINIREQLTVQIVAKSDKIWVANSVCVH